MAMVEPTAPDPLPETAASAPAPAPSSATPATLPDPLPEAAASTPAPAPSSATPATLPDPLPEAAASAPAPAPSSASSATPAVAVAASAKAPAKAKATAGAPPGSEITFKPVTADGISAFFSALRRPSTGQLSVCSTVEEGSSPNPDAAPAAPTPVADHPMPPAEPTPTMEPATATPVSTPSVSNALVHLPEPKATAPGATGTSQPEALVHQGVPSTSIAPATSPAPPVAEPKATAPEATGAAKPKATGPPSEAESIATTISLGPPWEKDEFTWEQQSDGTYVKKPKPATRPAPTTEAVAAVAQPAEAPPVVAPHVAAPAAPTQAEATAAGTPVAPAPAQRGRSEEEEEETKAQRAHYMKFYRNVRGPNCPKEVRDKFQEALNEEDKEAMTTANSNLLEISQLAVKLTKGGVTDIIRKALVEQMALEDAKIKDAKGALENAMAQDLSLDGLVESLEAANKHFKDQMKHATMHLPKAKAKAKPAAAPA
eukprot:s4489_g4.t1